MKTTTQLEQELARAKERNKEIEQRKEQNKKRVNLRKQIMIEKNKHDPVMNIIKLGAKLFFGEKRK